MLEDFFITDYVNNDLVKKSLELVEKDHIKFYQILVQLIKQTWEKGKPYKGDKHIHIIPENKNMVLIYKQQYGILNFWRKNWAR